jgi:hypothetical protein
MTRIPALALTDFEHLGAANRADSLSCRLAVLHFDGRRILHLPLGSALHTIRLHPLSPFLFVLAKQASTKSLSCQDGRSTFLKNVCTAGASEEHKLPGQPRQTVMERRDIDMLRVYFQEQAAVDISVENGLSSPHLYRTMQEDYSSQFGNS